MSSTDLFIIGNGFDLAHGMPTEYKDFRRWLIENDRLDVIFELQSAYPVKVDNDYLLWSDFENALGQYDLDKVISWSFEDLYLTDVSIGGLRFNSPNFFLNTQLPDIINEVFTNWVQSIEISKTKAFDSISSESLYLTFNYTDTLEHLYLIPERHVLHIHGRASKGDRLIVGHNRLINPGDYWDDKIDVRENNERMQRLVDMNCLCKPVDKIMERYDWYFKGLGFTEDVHILGHSCGEIDYPYFVKIKESLPINIMWHFHPHTPQDAVRIDKFVREMGIVNFSCD